MAKYKDIEPIIDFIKTGLNSPDKAKAFGYDAIEILTEIEYAPTVDVAEVRHGEWTLHKDGSGTCSECKKTQKNVWDYNSWQNYCGHCGAKMDGGKANDL